MTSYQRRKQEIEDLKKRVEFLEKEKKEILQEFKNDAKLFFAKAQWLGVGDMNYGVVCNGKAQEIDRVRMSHLGNTHCQVIVK